MERVRREIEKTKNDCAQKVKGETQSSRNEMEKVRQELEKAIKKMSKSEAHGELLRMQQDNAVS